MTHTIESLLDRTEADGDCLLWLGGTKNGVPCVYTARHTLYVRRLIVRLAEIEVPSDQRAETSCGNPLCVEPSHIVLVRNGARRPQRAAARERATPWSGLGARR